MNDSSWTTRKEIEFLDELGTKGYTNLSRKKLLRKYIAAIPLRVNWESMQKADVLEAAQTLLRNEY